MPQYMWHGIPTLQSYTSMRQEISEELVYIFYKLKETADFKKQLVAKSDENIETIWKLHFCNFKL